MAGLHISFQGECAGHDPLIVQSAKALRRADHDPQMRHPARLLLRHERRRRYQRHRFRHRAGDRLLVLADCLQMFSGLLRMRRRHGPHRDDDALDLVDIGDAVLDVLEMRH